MPYPFSIMAGNLESLLKEGYQARREHRIAYALDLYRQAVAILRTESNPLRLAHAVRHVGDIALEIDPPNLPLAEASFDEALTIYRSHPETRKLDFGNALRGYALLLAAQSKTVQAIEIWKETSAIYEQLDIREGVAECTMRIAALTPQ